MTEGPSSWEGRVAGIYITPRASAPVQAVTEVRAVAGRGLEGDRYFEGDGTWSASVGRGREVTLIESEAIQAIRAEDGIDIDPGEARRNIVTAGVALNHLVGRDFLVGPVRLRGIRLCEPCAHLSRLTGAPLIKALIHRGGLRAEIVQEGVIRVGDPIRPGAKEGSFGDR